MKKEQENIKIGAHFFGVRRCTAPGAVHMHMLEICAWIVHLQSEPRK
jgi:hypothetical protein